MRISLENIQGAPLRARRPFGSIIVLRDMVCFPPPAFAAQARPYAAAMDRPPPPSCACAQRGRAMSHQREACSPEPLAPPSMPSLDGRDFQRRNVMAVDGKWEIVINSPMGAQKATLDLATEGNSLTGSQQA